MNQGKYVQIKHNPIYPVYPPHTTVEAPDTLFSVERSHPLVLLMNSAFLSGRCQDDDRLFH